MATLTVAQLIAALRDLPQDKPVKVWLPGSTISLSNVFPIDRLGIIAIEGDVDPGSALG